MSPNLAVVGSFGGSPAQSPWSKSQANDQQQNAALGHQQPGAPFIVSPTPDYIDIRGFLERLLGFIGFESPGTVIDAEDGEVPKEIPLPKELLWIDQIVNGHGWEDHGQEDFRSKQEYKQAILDTVQNAKGNDVQHPDKFRTLFWNDKEGFAVWRDKNHPDQGTAYFPDSPDAFKKKWGIE